MLFDKLSEINLGPVNKDCFNEQFSTYLSSFTIRDSEESISMTSVSALLISFDVKGRLRTTTRILGGSLVFVSRSICSSKVWKFEVGCELFFRLVNFYNNF
jgi:hypothetical protein